MVDAAVVVDDVTTAIGEFCERTATVDVQDGRLTVELGLPGRQRNTCLNWLRIVRVEENETKGPSDGRP